MYKKFIYLFLLCFCVFLTVLFSNKIFVLFKEFERDILAVDFDKMYYNLFKERLLLFIKYSVIAFFGILFIQFIAYWQVKKSQIDFYNVVVVVNYFLLAVLYFFITLVLGLQYGNKIFDFGARLMEIGILNFLIYTLWQGYILMIVNL